jgi:hypothetical protein
MKNVLLVLSACATLLIGCDRQTLEGLRLNFQAQVNSNYDQSQASQADKSKQSTQAAPPQESHNLNPNPVAPDSQPASEVKSGADPDTAAPFNPLDSCSQGGIVAQTNEQFYKAHPQLKSIDSKDKQLVKEWKTIHAQVKEKCSAKL